MAYTSEKAKQIAKYLHVLQAPIVWGGIYATQNPHECLKYTDYICIGEGDEAILEFADKLSMKKLTNDIQNFWINSSTGIKKNKIRQLVKDIDKLPFEDYNFENHYIFKGTKFVRVRESDFVYGERYNLNIFTARFNRVALVQTSRGCPFKCTFCGNYDLKEIYGDNNYVRLRNYRYFGEFIKQLKHKIPGLKGIWFTDDNLMIRDQHEIDRISKVLKELDVQFMCYLNPLHVDTQKIEKLTDAGLTRIEMGIQTGSSRMARIYNRRISNTQIMKAARILQKFKDIIDPPVYQVISTNPMEKKEDIAATVSLIKKLPIPFTLSVFNMTIFPGSFCERIAKKFHIEQDNFSGVLYPDSPKHINAISSNSKRNLYILLDLLDGNHTRYRRGLVPIFIFNTGYRRFLTLTPMLTTPFLYLLSKKNYFYSSPYFLRQIFLRISSVKQQLFVSKRRTSAT